MINLKKIIGLLSIVFFIVITTFLYVNAEYNLIINETFNSLTDIDFIEVHDGSGVWSIDNSHCISGNCLKYSGGDSSSVLYINTNEWEIDNTKKYSITGFVTGNTASGRAYGGIAFDIKNSSDMFILNAYSTYDGQNTYFNNRSYQHTGGIISDNFLLLSIIGYSQYTLQYFEFNYSFLSSSIEFFEDETKTVLIGSLLNVYGENPYINPFGYLGFYGYRDLWIDNIVVYEYEELCLTNFSCNGYNTCIDNKRLCNSVIDNNNCSINYIGNYSEFNYLVCNSCISNFQCNAYNICNNYTLNPSCNLHIDNNLCGFQNCSNTIDLNNCGIDYLKNCSYNDSEIILTENSNIPLAFVYSRYENVPYQNEFCGQFFKVNESKVLKGFTFITGIVNNGGNVTFHLKEGYTLDYSQDLTKGNIFVYPEWAYYTAEFDKPYLLKPNTSYYIFLDVNEENNTIMDISAYGIDDNTNPDLYIMCNVTNINTIYNLSSYVYTMNLTFEDNIFCGGNYSEFSPKKCNLPPIIDEIYTNLYNTVSTNKSIDTIGFIFLIIIFIVLGILINYGFWFLVSIIFIVMSILSYIDTGDYKTNLIKTILYLVLALCFAFLGLVMLILSKDKGKEKGMYEDFYN